MVDFKKLRGERAKAAAIEPEAIFRRLPKPPGIKDIYVSQKEVFDSWLPRRNEKDLVIKLNTGGGKTLVGLLIAQSIMNEHQVPVLYLVPNNQLAEQILGKAAEYNIPAEGYVRNAIPESFFAGKAVLVANYSVLFNGRSKFGIRGSGDDIIKVGAIIVDDAHAAFSAIRDAFTLRIESAKQPEMYADLINQFRPAFLEIDRVGTFDDVVSGKDFGVLEVPYWAWHAKIPEVQEYLRTRVEKLDELRWRLIRNDLAFCHMFVQRSGISITPLMPLVDLFPTFADCPRRIFMSATIADDSEIVRTFDAGFDGVAKPITSVSITGIGERMILIPQLMQLPFETAQKTIEDLIAAATKDEGKAAVILVPSDAAAEAWAKMAEIAKGPSAAARLIQKLQRQETTGPVVLSNRYDGVDLAGDACRLLVVDGLPKGTSAYDMYRADAFAEGAVNTFLAQRLEQAIGRGARGQGDYCVVLLVGRDLVSWIGRASNTKYLTNTTRAQLEMGRQISKDVTDADDLLDTVKKCLDRDKDWVGYHAEEIAEAAGVGEVAINSLQLAAAERKALRLARSGSFEKAVSALTKYADTTTGTDLPGNGWAVQIAARLACIWGDSEQAQRLQERAYGLNSHLTRPRRRPPYVQIAAPGDQAKAIVARIEAFGARRAYFTDFEEKMIALVPEASSNRFEQAFTELGSALGFTAERPESRYGRGPDCLWRTAADFDLVVEAKSQKKPDQPLDKDEHGQLLVSEQWFNEHYPNRTCKRLAIHPNALAFPNAAAAGTHVLTLDKLNELVGTARVLLTELCESHVSAEKLEKRCEAALERIGLRPQRIISKFTRTFKTVKPRT